MKIFYILLLTLLFLMPSACKKDKQEHTKSSGKESEIYYNTLDRATKAFEQENYKETEKLIKRAINLEPGMPMAYYMYGMLYVHSNDFLKAGQNFEMALKRSTLSEKKRLIDEIDSMTGFIADDDDVNLLEKATNLLDKGNYKQSLLIVEKLLTKYPYNPDVLYLCGTNGIKKGNKDASLHLEKAIKVHPAHQLSFKSLMDYYKETRSNKKLTQLYETYIDYFGESADICTEYAIHVYNCEDTEKALILLDQNIDKFPDYHINHFFAGKIHYSLNKNDLGLKHLSAFIEKSKGTDTDAKLVKEAEQMLIKLK
ncbi:MAG TPA: hypothetical protein P5123_00585 [Spirochaetota bacterium]|nr:hypothetical protein [Spirochaetota bacterium]